jgi:hypothetical protein
MDALRLSLCLDTNLLDLDTAIGLEILAFVVRDNRTAFGVVVSVSLETLHLSRLHVVEVLLAEMDATDLVADNVCLDVLLCLCLWSLLASLHTEEQKGDVGAECRNIPQDPWASS